MHPTSVVHDILQKITRMLVQTWEETGYGELKIVSQRKSANGKIVVTIQAGTHYQYVVRAEELEESKHKGEIYISLNSMDEPST